MTQVIYEGDIRGSCIKNLHSTYNQKKRRQGRSALNELSDSPFTSSQQRKRKRRERERERKQKQNAMKRTSLYAPCDSATRETASFTKTH